jgi:site-specific DNA-cytosine methylase
METTQTIKQQTPVERLADYIRSRYETNQVFENLVDNLIEKEKRNIIEAIIYALDEDGHTGDWKIKFAKDYYTKHYEKTIQIS